MKLSQISFLFRYLNYRLTAKHKNGHGIHSPFLYHLITEIFEDENRWYAQDDILKLYDELWESDEKIKVTDFGAGSKKMSSDERYISDILHYSATSEKYGELLFRLVKYFKPRTILEFGTSLGIGTLNLALPNLKAEVHTIEGCPNTAEIAKQNFAKLNTKNITQHVGNMDVILDDVLSGIKQLDFVFFDGNHQKKATLNYFNKCLPLAHNDTVFIFDDINWTKGMQQAWNQIKQSEKATLTLETFHFGFVFFKKELSKQHFKIRF